VAPARPPRGAQGRLGTGDHRLDHRTRLLRSSAVTIFTLWFENFPNNLPALILSVGVAVLFVFIFLKAAISSDGRSRWVKRITGPNGKWFFGLLFIGWAVVFGVGLQLVPHIGANSPYGGLGLIALFSGVFISMGFLWSVIGE
jgi:hypothetical protein